MYTFKNNSFGFKKFISNFINVIIFSFTLFIFFGVSNAFAYTNLVVNPGAEIDSMNGWVVDLNGGNGWATDWNGPGHSDERVFSTSYDWSTRHQIIDLLDAGYTEGQLDSQTFNIKMSEWIYTRGDQGGSYYLDFRLLAADGVTVLDSYERGTISEPINLSSGVNWFQETHTFTNIPIGTRYVYFGDGGKDQSVWSGHYGVNFDDASVVVSDTPFRELSYTSGVNGTLTGTITQTLSDGSNGSAVTAVPQSGYVFVNWSDDSVVNPRTDLNVTQNISVTANFTDVTSPVISDISSNSITRDNATITWTTNEVSSSIISYGVNNYNTTTFELDTSPRVTSHSVVLGGLVCGTIYSFKVISKDSFNNVSIDNNSNFTTSDCPAAAIPLWILREISKASNVSSSPVQQISSNNNFPTSTHTSSIDNSLANKYIFTNTIKQGQNNSDVKRLQEFLKEQGEEIYPEGIVSGYFGILTKKAVVRFQEKYAEDILFNFKNKKGTGVVGEYTIKKIKEISEINTIQ